MDKRWHRYCGSLQQEIYARPIIYREGRAEGLNAIEVKCGGISYHVMADKCLDVSDLSFRGMNMTFLAKTGLAGRNHYDTHGQEALRSIMGGLFFTCGYENICAPCTVDGKDYPMHGRMRSTPAEHVSVDVVPTETGYKTVIRGEVREAELFGENMVLRRTIVSELGKNSICLIDEVENQSFRDEPLLLLYHCNAGYPFLDETAELILPTAGVRGREAFSEEHADRWNFMEPPKDNEPEYVFIHEMLADESGQTAALIANRGNGTALLLEFNRRNLPYFMEWKSTASGDYTLGLEPSNAPVYGKRYQMENGGAHYLKPFEKETFTLRFTALSGAEEIGKAEQRIAALKKGGNYETLEN